MTLYGVEKRLQFDPYRFEVCYDSGSETGLNQRDIWYQEKQGGHWTEPAWLRSFYFEEVRDPHIQNFCRRFSRDEAYRSTCLARQTEWAQRDDLFDRNIEPFFWQERTLLQSLGLQGTWQFFKTHWRTILALPEYQQLVALDSSFQPSKDELDPEIRAAVAAFNAVPGVTTRFSCQGVSGTIRFAEHRILAVTPHQEYGGFCISPKMVHSRN